MKCFHYGVTICFEDTDAAGVVYYANYLRYFERARSAMFRELGYSQVQLKEESALGFVVKRVAQDLHKPSSLEDVLDIRTSILEVSRASVLLKQDVYKENEDTPLVEGSVLMVAVDTSSFKPKRIPKDMYQQLNSLLKVE